MKREISENSVWFVDGLNQEVYLPTGQILDVVYSSERFDKVVLRGVSGDIDCAVAFIEAKSGFVFKPEGYSKASNKARGFIGTPEELFSLVMRAKRFGIHGFLYARHGSFKVASG